MESICRHQNKCYVKLCVSKVRKHRGKRRKCWLPAFSPFLQCFQMDSYSGSGLCGKELNFYLIMVLLYLLGSERSSTCSYLQNIGCIWLH